MSEFRTSRVGEQIREEISTMIMTGKIKDSRVSSFLSVNSVVVSSDLSHAKVYVSSFMDEHKTKQGVRGLENAGGFIRTMLSKKMHIRKFPELKFFYDKNMKAGFDMIKKLDALEISPATEEDGSAEG
ncbi:MAG: ribosome-binding factor A [Treponema sp.]|nr:MAG: ribosome-binding factor A [Treponema sp.]